jgi:hypothetical protein
MRRAISTFPRQFVGSPSKNKKKKNSIHKAVSSSTLWFEKLEQPPSHSSSHHHLVGVFFSIRQMLHNQTALSWQCEQKIQQQSVSQSTISIHENFVMTLSPTTTARQAAFWTFAPF